MITDYEIVSSGKGVCTIRHEGIEKSGIRVSDKLGIHCLADRCAPLFGFHYFGSVCIRIQGKRYTFTPIKEVVLLSGVSNTLFRKRVQDFVVYRWIMGSPVVLGDLFLYENRLGAFFHLRREEAAHPVCCKGVMVDTIADSVRRLLKGRNASNMRQLIEEEMKKINTELLFMSAEIVGRMMVDG